MTETTHSFDLHPQLLATLYSEYMKSIATLVERRDRQSYFFFVTNAAYFAAMNFVLSQLHGNAKLAVWLQSVEQILLIAICGIGILTAILWMHQVHVFHNVLTAKFHVLCALEQRHLVPLHDLEYEHYRHKAHRLAVVLHSIAIGAIAVYLAILVFVLRQAQWA